MTARQKFKRVLTLNVNLETLTLKQVVVIVGGLITLFGGGNIALVMHQATQQDALTAKVDSAKIVVDSTARPKFAMRADMDTVKREQRQLRDMVIAYIQTNAAIVTELKGNILALKRAHLDDSAEVAYNQTQITFNYRLLETATRRIATLENEYNRRQ